MPGFQGEGSIRLASSKARLAQMQQHALGAKHIALEAHFITLREVREMFPLLDLTGVRSSAFMLMYGVVWVSLIWMYRTEVRSRDVVHGALPAPAT